MEEFPLNFGERVIAAVRKHWFVLVLELLPFVVLFLAPTILPQLVAWVARASETPVPFAEFFTYEDPIARFVLGLWWLMVWIGAFNTFTRYYLNLWVITTSRIVYIHQHGFFNREVSSFLLSRVQDVTTDVDGFFATLLGYGSLRVQTAGTDSSDFRMEHIPHPAQLRDRIMRLLTELKSEKQNEPSLAQKVLNEIV